MSSHDHMSIFMTFMLESCVEIGFQCSICLFMINEDRLSTFWEAMGVVLAVILAVALLIAPVYLFVIGQRLF